VRKTQFDRLLQKYIQKIVSLMEQEHVAELALDLVCRDCGKSHHQLLIIPTEHEPSEPIDYARLN